MSDHGRRRPSQQSLRASVTDIAIVAVGLAAALGSSVAAYHVVGPYGDGPLNVGVYRAQDPDTGEQFVYRDVRNADGTVLRYLFEDSSRKLTQVLVMRSVNGKLETVGLHMGSTGLTRVDVGGHSVEGDAKAGFVKVGFSLRGNGVIDAWEYRDAKGQLLKIEVSRSQDGRIDRWEYYKDEQLARVEADENRDGRIDHWLNYESGILVKEAWDRDGDGRPDPGR